MSVEEDRERAKVKLKGVCGVYRICDGHPSRLCQGQSYGRPLGIGGIGSGASFTANCTALEALRLKMRLIGEHFEPDTKTTFLRNEISMPIMGASVSGVNSFGGDSVITEKELCRSIVLGCKKAGTIGFRGDTYTYSYDNTPCLEAIAEAKGWGVKIWKPREQEMLLKLIRKTEEQNIIAVGVDIDGCGSYAMPKHGKPVFRKSEKELKELVNSTKLPFILKGIMCIEDAEIAADIGAAAIVVSNHGGRVLDSTPGTAEVLPEIAVKVGKKVVVLVDGGIRTGYDVLKMLALGAKGVLVGRDVIRAAVGGGIAGVQRQMEYLQKTLAKAMKMTGCSSLNDISRNILYNY
ncbi:MAG: alpha-hydroxy-acid oxidizing protein [Candidatus Helarchaeota archaeon]